MNGDGEKKVNAKTYWRITAAYALAVLVGALFLGYFSSEGREQLQPDEWGAVLGGVFSPLAFLWLIFASLSQREELGLQREQLKLQRNELILTRDELKRNADAQIEQKMEMAAQVDALKAHTKLLEAQATATYEPVFVVTSVDGILALDSHLTLYIENGGGDVIDISAEDGQRLLEINTTGAQFSRSIRGGVTPHWPKGARVKVWIDLKPYDTRDEVKLALNFKRLDTSRRRIEFILRDGGYLLKQVQSRTDGILVQSLTAHATSTPKASVTPKLE